MMNTRSVSFVERFELDFYGNHFSHALALGDVDGDGLNEFIIGNVDGELAIFKGNGSSKPWCKATGLGSITCVLAGNLFNNNKDELICMNAMGMCYIFAVYDTKSPSLRASPKTTTEIIRPTYTQELPPNIKVMLVAGISPDGKEELFVGHTDRYLGVYRWNNDFRKLQLQKRIMLERQIGSLSLTMTSDGRSQVLVSQVGGTYVPLEYVENLSIEEEVGGEKEESIGTSMNSSLSRDKDISISLDEEKGAVGPRERGESGGEKRKEEEESKGKGKGKKISFDNSAEKRRQSDSVINSKPKRHFFRQSSLGSSGSNSGNIRKRSRGSSLLKEPVGVSTTSKESQYELVTCPIVGLAQRNSPSSLTEVIGDIRERPQLSNEDLKHPNIVALCTLDGCIRFMKDEQKVWEHQVDHNLFALAKLDITNDGQDEILVCAWNGTTYILDHSRNVVRYKFEDNVCAFCAGLFGFASEHNKPCLIYSTFFNKIYIYHNITLPSISPFSLTLKIAQDKDTPDSSIQLLQSLSDKDKRKLIHDTMYNPNSLPSTLNSLNL